MAPGQRKFTIVPSKPGHMGDAPPPPELRRPMTTKQARKAFLERTRGPRLSRAEQRARERRLQEEIRRDLREKDQREKEERDRERQQRKAKILREKKRAREDAEREAKRKAGVPIAPPRPSQPTLAGFFNGNAAGKRRVKEDAEVRECEEVTICKEPEGEGDLPSLPSPVALNPVRKRVKIESRPTERTPSPRPQLPTATSTPQASEGGSSTLTRSSTPPAIPKTSPVRIPAFAAEVFAAEEFVAQKFVAEKFVAADFAVKVTVTEEFVAADIVAETVLAEAETNPDDDARCQPDPALDLADIEALFPSGTQLQRELFEEHDDSGFSEPEAPVSKPDRDKPPKNASPIYRDTRDTGPSARAFQPTVVEAENYDMMPFFCTQDCVLSTQDVEEIETPTRPAARPTPVFPMAPPRPNMFPGRSQYASRISARNRSHYLNNSTKSPARAPVIANRSHHLNNTARSPTIAPVLANRPRPLDKIAKSPTTAPVMANRLHHLNNTTKSPTTTPVKPLASTVMANRGPPPRPPVSQRASPPLSSSATTRSIPKLATVATRTPAAIATATEARSQSLAAEDLRAMQEASWDDDEDDDYDTHNDENTENQVPPCPLIRPSSELPSQPTKRSQVDTRGGDIQDAWLIMTIPAYVPLIQQPRRMMRHSSRPLLAEFEGPNQNHCVGMTIPLTVCFVFGDRNRFHEKCVLHMMGDKHSILHCPTPDLKTENREAGGNHATRTTPMLAPMQTDESLCLDHSIPFPLPLPETSSARRKRSPYSDSEAFFFGDFDAFI
ncbi:hypothetical protein ACRALDRAFT_1094903 [Sodiomyces alcalophilus JCM 7366]|uniref:uncharacterized protein n=1 Tax=Sodiomyces alcalophilus JCM 7366 TaxID=591952 RepID=UPI0039B43BF9